MATPTTVENPGCSLVGSLFGVQEEKEGRKDPEPTLPNSKEGTLYYTTRKHQLLARIDATGMHMTTTSSPVASAAVTTAATTSLESVVVANIYFPLHILPDELVSVTFFSPPHTNTKCMFELKHQRKVKYQRLQQQLQPYEHNDTHTTIYQLSALSPSQNMQWVSSIQQWIQYYKAIQSMSCKGWSLSKEPTMGSSCSAKDNLVKGGSQGTVGSLSTRQKVHALLDTFHAKEQYNDVLWESCARGYESVVQHLLTYCRADPGAIRSNDGMTPCLLAAKHGHASILRMLLLQDTEPTPTLLHSRCKEGHNAMWYALHHGHEPIILVLLEANACVVV